MRASYVMEMKGRQVEMVSEYQQNGDWTITAADGVATVLVGAGNKAEPPLVLRQSSHPAREVASGQVQHCIAIFVPAVSGPSAISAAVRTTLMSCPLTGHLSLSMTICQQSAVMVSGVAPGGQIGSDCDDSAYVTVPVVESIWGTR